jgi:hypothetical protein
VVDAPGEAGNVFSKVVGSTSQQDLVLQVPHRFPCPPSSGSVAILKNNCMVPDRCYDRSMRRTAVQGELNQDSPEELEAWNQPQMQGNVVIAPVNARPPPLD